MIKQAVTALVLTLAPLAALGQSTAQPVVIGANYTVNASPGTQTDPHVSGDTVAYSNLDNSPFEIRYHDLTTGTDTAIPSTGDRDILSDISGNRIIFTRVTGSSSSIFLYDSTTSAAPVELAPDTTGTNPPVRTNASIGTDTVAWVDFGVTGSTAASEVVVYDIASGTTTSLTPGSTDTNTNPNVSPDGNTVAFTRCPSTGTGSCDIYVSQKVGGVWTTSQLTSGAANEDLPATDGTIVAYQSDSHIAYQTLGTSGETVINMTGTQGHPAVAGGLIAFESSDATGQTDLFLYDTATGNLYQLTNTPESESLSDIYVDATGLVRVTYVKQDVSTGADVYAFSFFIEQPINTCDSSGSGSGSGDDDGDHDGGHCHAHHNHHFGHHHSHHGGSTGSSTDCANPGNRPVLATLTLTRTTGAPNTASTAFSATAGNGLLCVTNNQATSGHVYLNGSEEVGPGSFQHSVSSIERIISLGASNTLSGKIAGQKGTSYTVTVYGSDPDTCETEEASLSAASLRLKNVGDAQVHSVAAHTVADFAPANDGLEQLDLGNADQTQGQALPTIEGESFGCSSTGSAGGAVMLALLALAGLLLRARPAAVKVRAHRE